MEATTPPASAAPTDGTQVDPSTEQLAPTAGNTDPATAQPNVAPTAPQSAQPAPAPTDSTGAGGASPPTG
jgi:hypothetical protein